MNRKLQEQNPAFLSLFCQELGMLFGGGISLSDACFIMEENASSSHEAQLYHALGQNAQEGVPFYQSLAQTGQFPAYMIRMVHIGESSGKMEDVFRALELFYRRQEQLRSNIKNAVVYPMIMVLVMLFILAVLMIKVLPVFSQVFEQVGAQLPPILQTIADSSHIVTLVCVITAIVLAAVFFLYCLIKCNPKKYQSVIDFFARLRLTKKLSQKSDADDFIYSISLLLSSGVSADDAIDIIIELTASSTMKEKLTQLRQDMDQGTSFPQALTVAGLLPAKYSAMVAAGMKTGHMDEVMDVVAQRSAEDTRRLIDHIISGIEPVIVIFMCLIIGSVLMSVMLPLMKIMTSM